MSHIFEFKRRLHGEWLQPFCISRGYAMGGFVEECINNLEPHDAKDFMAAMDSGLVVHQKGTFLAPRSCAKEQLFWEHGRDTVPRKITLWLEPVITMAGLMRLFRDFGWPANQLGLQSETWAFDLVGYAEDGVERLVCEVKKTRKEVDKLIELMKRHQATPNSTETELNGAELNAMRKVIGLRRSRASVFWVLDPGGYEQIFSVNYNADGSLTLNHVHVEALVLSRC